MNILRWSLTAPSLLVLAACVTINVYFPAAVADRVADQFVRDVYGADAGDPPAAPETGPQSSRQLPQRALLAMLDFVIPPAHAAADFDASSPAIQRIKSSLQDRHLKLEPFYATGAIGMTNNGEISVRELGAVALPMRNALRKMVADENAERAALYREIAIANEHPEWEPEIRAVFAERWISNARSGWYYQDKDGNWKTK